MPHAVVNEQHAIPRASSPRKSRGKSSKSRDHHLESLLEDAKTLYYTSAYSRSLSRSLASAVKNAQTPITRILSLGLGSLSSPQKGQVRRIKQLAILLAIRDQLQQATTKDIEVYAQDPVFTKQDEAFLNSLNIHIVRTHSGSSLGESSSLLSASTLIYSPFLTLEAYEALFAAEPRQLQVFVSDDFIALREKWPKFSAERAQVDRLVKGAVGRYRRRAIVGDEFWNETDECFPMSVYSIEVSRKERARI